MNRRRCFPPHPGHARMQRRERGWDLSESGHRPVEPLDGMYPDAHTRTGTRTGESALEEHSNHESIRI